MPNHQQKHREVLNECEMNMIDFNEIKRIIAKGTVSVLYILEVEILSHRFFKGYATTKRNGK